MLLTLGLPVYNGAYCLSKTLQSIVASLDNCQNKELFEIIISDNASTDETYTSIKEYLNSGLTIKYFCNTKNIGYDGNIDAIVQRANGKYVWFLGCGETLKEDALERLVEKLTTDIEYSNILLDFDIYDERLGKISDTRIYSFDNDIVLEGKNNFLHDKYGPAVSSNIINTKLWNQVSGEQLFVNGWAHIERILSIIALYEDSKTLILPHPYFTLFREKNGWWTKPNSYLLLLLLLHIKVIRSMLHKGFDLKVVNQLQHKQSRMTLINAIIQSKGYGLKMNIQIFNNMLVLFKKDYFFWLFALPLLMLPNSLLFIPRSIFRLKNILIKVSYYVKKTIY